MFARLRIAVLITAAALIAAAGCKPKQETGKTEKSAGPSRAQTVVVYAAHDKVFSEPILRKFTAETGIEVKAKYDTEATKTIGLVNTIREEAKAGRVRCDVFWNNEPMNTVRLKKEGLLAAYHSPQAAAYPPEFRDPNGMWTGFGGRARVIIVNTKLVPADRRPRSIFDLTKPEWKGKAGIAKPLFGTTATQIACLWATVGPEKTRKWLGDLKANDIVVCAGNRDCARQVGQGRIAVALTDNDDFLAEKAGGAPVDIVYPDSAKGEQGTLFLSNTVVMLKGAPHPEAAKKLIDYLLSEEVECALAKSGSGQAPLRIDAKCKSRIRGPGELATMRVDMDKAAAAFKDAMAFVEEVFLE